MDNPSQVITDFEEEIVKKKNKCAAKKKKLLVKLCVFVRSLSSPCLKSSPLLLLCFVLALMPVFLPAPIPAFILALVTALMPAPVSCLGSLVILLSRHISALAASITLSLPCHFPISCCGISALLLLLFLLGLLFPLGLLLLKTFKQLLLDGSQIYVLTSLAKPLCLFLALGMYNSENNNGLYNLTNNNKRKQIFNITFINSHLLAGNHDQKEVDLSFAGCGCPDTVKLNRSWQLNLLDPKPVYIIEAIPLIAAYNVKIHDWLTKS